MLQYVPMSNQHKRIVSVAQTLKLQLMLSLIVVTLFVLFKQNINSILSSCLGGLVAIVATLIYVRIAFAKGVVAYPRDAYVRHKKAMLYRFVTNLVLLSLVFMFYRKCDSLAFMITYCVTFCAYWLALISKQR